MSIPSAISRSAPIAIAPKPSRFANRSGGIQQDIFPGSFHHSGFDTPDSAGSPSAGFPAWPCEACQQRRLKCVMNDDDDACLACRARGTECSLVGSPPPRKRKLHGDYGESLSKRGSPGLDNGRSGRHHHSSLSSTAASSSFIEEMANFGGPTMLSRTLGLQHDRYSQYIGPTTDFEPSLINLSTFDPHDESLLSRGTLRKVSEHDTFLLLPDQNTIGYEHIVEDVDEIEKIVAPHGRKLIDLYFRIVHPALPIIQKSVFYEKYERSPREFSPPLLAAMYILAINWWDQDDTLSALPRPNVRDLERLVRTTLPDAMYRPKLSTVQAGLLLSQRPEGDQWAPTAQLIAIAQELGLHLDCTNWKIPLWEKGLRRRLAWGLYMQDKWGALVHGRPSHIFASQWAVPPLGINDFPDVEWEEDDVDAKQDIEKGRTLFMQMIQLSLILAEILETFYTLQAMQNVTNAGAQGTHLVLSLAKPIQLKLKEWYAALPASIRMDSTYQTPIANANPNRLSSIGYLHLGYFATEITLHRRIVRSLATTHPPPGSPHEPSNMTTSPSGSAASDNYVLHICRNAAKARLISAMDFVNRLTPSHLRAFWYFASKTNFALIGTFGSLLWATSPGREEAEWYRRRLGEYRWTLSVSSKPGEGKGLTEFAMGMLDISTGLLKKLPEKPSMSRSGSLAGLAGSASTRRLSLLSLGGTYGLGGGLGVIASGDSGSGMDIDVSGGSGMPSEMHSPRSQDGEGSEGSASGSVDEAMYGGEYATSAGRIR
ncbi:fungal-specific transcription factor domain-domain-containing protein [Coniella lustricola]|uniref:Fungal-specific transcription factor domain-domain-containing protein n=1 Tax=Coniella lustricola TaxID=2025994 RepID=A0A2T3AGN3_9PEZI|nr:fungal-specific transcription factor domain-domain-containing protein [Coniella lustricola]